MTPVVVKLLSVLAWAAVLAGLLVIFFGRDTLEYPATVGLGVALLALYGLSFVPVRRRK